MGEESEDLKFAEVNCMEALDVCTEEGVEGFPQVYMYKDGVMEDIFQGERTVEELTNFVWETVDPSRVKDDDLDTMLLMQNLMGGDQAGQDEEEDLATCAPIYLPSTSAQVVWKDALAR